MQFRAYSRLCEYEENLKMLTMKFDLTFRPTGFHRFQQSVKVGMN